MGKVNQDIKTRKPLQKCELEKKKNERRKKKRNKRSNYVFDRVRRSSILKL